MRSIKITWDNGKTTETNINGTEESIRNYYIGRTFNLGNCDKDMLAKAVDVTFTDGKESA